MPVPVTVTRPRRPRLRAALALGLASLALAACGTDLAGAASVAGTQTVRDAEVAAAFGTQQPRDFDQSILTGFATLDDLADDVLDRMDRIGQGPGPP